jgi:hypothetical protein
LSARGIARSVPSLAASFAALAASALFVGAIPGQTAEASAAKAGRLPLGIWDDSYMSPDDDYRGFWLDRTVEAGARQVTLPATWRSIATAEPAAPENPADPAYHWAVLDEAVSDAASRGLEILILINRAPDWAEGPEREPSALPGTWLPQPRRLAQFSRAIASRYSGTFPDPANPEAALPRVSLWEIWGEPNLGTFLNPQAVSNGGKLSAAAAKHLRAMVNAASRSIKRVDRSNQVIAGGTAPFGDHPFQAGSYRTPPLTFWRAFFCLRGKSLQPTKRCRGGKPRVDAFAHNPLAGLAASNGLPTLGPHDTAPWGTDILVPDMHKLYDVLRAAQKHRQVKPRSGLELWVTELLWETNPPDPNVGVAPETQARYLTESIRLLRKQSVSRVVWINIVDNAFDPAHPSASYQSGLYFRDGTAKPALDAFRAAAMSP